MPSTDTSDRPPFDPVVAPTDMDVEGVSRVTRQEPTAFHATVTVRTVEVAVRPFGACGVNRPLLLGRPPAQPRATFVKAVTLLTRNDGVRLPRPDVGRETVLEGVDVLVAVVLPTAVTGVTVAGDTRLPKALATYAAQTRLALNDPASRPVGVLVPVPVRAVGLGIIPRP